MKLVYITSEVNVAKYDTVVKAGHLYNLEDEIAEKIETIGYGKIVEIEELKKDTEEVKKVTKAKQR